MSDRYVHCTFCGARFLPGQAWPRRCGACGETSYRNPTPVAVAVQPVDAGLLVVRRSVAPARGELALPGGYVDVGETWQQAAARELAEEARVDADPAGVRLFDTVSAGDDTLLVFGLMPPIRRADVPPSRSGSESLGWEVLDGPATLGFQLHTEAVRRYFAEVVAGF